VAHLPLNSIFLSRALSFLYLSNSLHLLTTNLAAVQYLVWGPATAITFSLSVLSISQAAPATNLPLRPPPLPKSQPRSLSRETVSPARSLTFHSNLPIFLELTIADLSRFRLTEALRCLKGDRNEEDVDGMPRPRWCYDIKKQTKKQNQGCIDFCVRKLGIT
jgi:hypothetical protein